MSKKKTLFASFYFEDVNLNIDIWSMHGFAELSRDLPEIAVHIDLKHFVSPIVL